MPWGSGGVFIPIRFEWGVKREGAYPRGGGVSNCVNMMVSNLQSGKGHSGT